jgi:ABC-type multidrug transport system ATPase subunit
MILQLDNVDVGYKKPIIEDLSLGIKQGQTILLKGLNGSGKSTLIRSICGLQPILKGELKINGEILDKSNHNRIVKNACSVLLTSALMANGITVQEYLDLHENTLDPEELKFLKASFEIDKLLSKKLDEISDGEKQKVLLVKTLSKKASLYILDEPTTFLDYRAKDVFYNSLAAANEKTFLVSSHDIERMEAICDGVVEV